MLKGVMVFKTHNAAAIEDKGKDKMKGSADNQSCTQNKEQNKDMGFTLLETLIALAILSFISLALFQSTSSLLSVSDRAIQSGERTLDGALNRVAFARVIDGILPHWEDQAADTAFRGTDTKISGISTQNLNLDKARLSSFSIEIIKTGQERDLGKSSMIYSTDTLSWPMDIDLPDTARFYYLGRDQKWYTQWPSDEMPKAAFEIDKTFSTPQIIPLAISVQAPDGEVFWMAKVDQNRHLPSRFELFYNDATN